MPDENPKQKCHISPKRLAELALGWKEKVVLDKGDEVYTELLRLLGPNNPTFCFETTTTEKPSHVNLWRRYEWELHYEKWKNDKLKAEERLQAHEDNKSTFMYLRELIIKKLGDIAGAIVADSLVTKMMAEKNEMMALQFGAEKERLKW